MKQRFSKRTRLVSALLTLAMVFTFLPFSAFADDEVDFWVPLHSENFPDKTFLEYIRTTFDKGGSEDGEPNGILEPGEWRAVTTIDVCNKNITSLWGITCFRNLKKLYCSNNQLTSLNLSYNTKLTQENLKCTGNKYPITIDETERTFDLSTLPAGFDVNKTSEWVGGTVSGNTLKVKPGATQVTYTYDCGNGLTSVFSLQVLTITRIKQVNLRVNTPKKNEMPDETVVILDNGADVCDAKIYWVEGDGVGGKPITGTFRPGKRYTLQVGLYAKPGYKFSKDTVCTVNGRETEFIWTQNDDTEYCAIKHYSVSLNPGGFEHDHKMEMTHDEHSHWKECPICHTVQDTEAHVYDDDKDTTCNVCGYVRSLTPGGTPGGSTPGGSTPGGSTPGGSTGGWRCGLRRVQLCFRPQAASPAAGRRGCTREPRPDRAAAVEHRRPSRACRGPGLCRRGRPGYRQGSPVVRGAGADEAPPERQICPGQQHPGLSGAERLPEAGRIKPLSLASPGSSPDRGAKNAGVFRQMTSKRSRCPDFPIRRGGAA